MTEEKLRHLESLVALAEHDGFAYMSDLASALSEIRALRAFLESTTKAMETYRTAWLEAKERVDHAASYFEDVLADCDSPGTRQTLEGLLSYLRGS